jgi:hypothetical protein
VSGAVNGGRVLQVFRDAEEELANQECAECSGQEWRCERAPVGPSAAEVERRLVALQRSRETRLLRFLERLEGEAQTDEELLRFDAEAYGELRYLRPRTLHCAADV